MHCIKKDFFFFFFLLASLTTLNPKIVENFRGMFALTAFVV